jgi:hypothetical protein
MGLPEMPQRPGAESEALEMSLTGDIESVAVATDVGRCTRCLHPIFAPASLRAGLGPVCRARRAAMSS